jgi:hypothetical protein
MGLTTEGRGPMEPSACDVRSFRFIPIAIRFVRHAGRLGESRGPGLGLNR